MSEKNGLVTTLLAVIHTHQPIQTNLYSCFFTNFSNSSLGYRFSYLNRSTWQSPNPEIFAQDQKNGVTLQNND